MLTIDCLFPGIVAVYSLGSAIKKDGSRGHKVVFGSAIGDIKPDINGEVPAVYQVPCGKCYNCRKQQAYAWSVRIQMEQLSHPQSECCFLTLTYDDAHLPPELNHKHVQKFMHTLRVIIDRHCGAKIRFFLSGEYGSKLGRPHFHLMLFGYDFFKDAQFSMRSQSGAFLYTHDFINRAWPYGLASFGEVTAASAMYVAQYTTKKLLTSDELLEGRTPPYIQMSRRPGIGHQYLIDHAEEIANDGGVYLNGKFIRINRYMLKTLLANGDLTLLDRARIHEMSEETAKLNVELWQHLHDGYYINFVRDSAMVEQVAKANEKKTKGDVF